MEPVYFRDFCHLDILGKGGYVAHEGYMGLMLNAHYYYGETDIIEKVNKNEEGFFDFSKGLIDIGSEIGVYCMGTNFSHYYLFEGNKEKYILSQMNMLLNEKAYMADAFNVLLSDKDEEIDYDGFLTEYSEVEPGIYKTDMVHKQPATTLDRFNLKNIGMIKIDVEGMEEKVIRGGVNTIEENGFPPILFELWDVGHWGMTQERHDKLENLLRYLGYDIEWYWGDFETHLAVRRENVITL